MSILGRIFSASDPLSDFRNPALWLEDWAGLGSANRAKIPINEETSLGLSAYWVAIRAISEDLAKLPLSIIRVDGERREEATDHPLRKLLRRAPNRNMTSFAFRETLTAWTLGWGNGYAEIQRNLNGDPIALWPIHPSRVSLSRRVTDIREGVVYAVGTDDIDSRRQIDIPGEDMLHIRGLGSEIFGFSVLRYASESLGIGLAADRYAASFFGNGTHEAGVLETEGVIKDDAVRQRMRTQFAERYSGLDNAFRPIILEEGLTWKRMGIEPEAAQLLDSRQFSVEEMARWFRIPPPKLMALLRATYNNVEQLNTAYAEDTIHPWATRWETELEKKLFPTERFQVRINLRALLRGDMSARADFYNRLFHIGAMSPNEIRALEDLNPVQGGDQNFAPLNMVRLRDAGVAQEPRGAVGAPERDEDQQRTRKDDAVPRRGGRAAQEAFESLRDEAIERALRKEDKAVTNVLKRATSTPESVREWCRKFYSGLMQDSLDSRLRILGAASSSGVELEYDVVEMLSASQRSVVEIAERNPADGPKRIEEWAAYRELRDSERKGEA